MADCVKGFTKVQSNNMNVVSVAHICDRSLRICERAAMVDPEGRKANWSDRSCATSGMK